MNAPSLAPAPSVVHVQPATNKLGEPISPFILSLKKLQDDAEASRERLFTEAEMREYNAYLDAQDAEECECSARAAEAAEELGAIEQFA